MTRIRAITALILAAAVLSAGCHFSADGESQIQRWGGLFSEVRDQWSAEPGIELTTGPVVSVRAYIESTFLAAAMGNLDYAYPGFTEAVAPNDTTGALGANTRRPALDIPLKSALVGNYRLHVLSVQHSGRDVAATVCTYSYRVAKEQDNGTFKSVQSGIGESRGIYVERVMLVAPAGDVVQPSPQAGFGSAPSNNVFGGWRITANLEFFHARQPGFETLWPTYDADNQACIDKAPDLPQRRAFLIDGEHPRSEFPTAPPDPGWPAP
ncbi:hypothetical protein [Mycobacterium sp. NPDC050853]|uniref:hypothetical protein n=1 Tax=Mycobacterium sp. NPDC050853 TaxID=3155160 RepID=UPI0033FA4B8A